MFDGVRIGVPICEDIWSPDPIECIVETGGEILLAPNASPYERDKIGVRLKIARARVAESGLPLVYLNQVGGQDELVFEGGSFVVNPDGVRAVQLPTFRSIVARTVWSRGANGWRCVEGPQEPIEQGDEGDYAACVLGLRDYVNDNRFPGVVLGLSGGVDSALCAAIAVDALGPERVHALMLPYRFTAEESLRDAAACAKALGVRYDIVPIAEPVEGAERALAPLFAGRPRDVTEENLQSRARGMILMSISNKFGAMLVTTGNKSEMSVGYATLYGDMNGGFNPIKDVYKTEVFRLATCATAGSRSAPRGRTECHPARDHRPAADRRAARQPARRRFAAPYPVLDAILYRLVEQEMRLSDIVAEGYDPEIVHKVERLLYLAEYKRRQSAPGVKVGSKNFGRDRRYPIVNRFRDRRPVASAGRRDRAQGAGGNERAVRGVAADCF